MRFQIIYWLLRLSGMRNRLRCRVCLAVGTYKPHLGCKGVTGDDVPNRWLCKYCGYYSSEFKSGPLCYPSAAMKVWTFVADAEQFGDTDTRTPKEVIQQWGNAWPWRG